MLRKNRGEVEIIMILIRVLSSVTYMGLIILLPSYISAHMGHLQNIYIKIKCLKLLK
jgi:hypothetical protein